MSQLRVLLVDDHVLFRKGVAALLRARSGFDVVGEAGDGIEAIARARETLPDIILMDITMPHCTGLEATRRIKREMPSVKIIMLTVADDDQNLFEAIKSGAQGYLLKDLEPGVLFDMLERVAKGEAPLSGMMAARILEEFTRPRDTAGLPLEDENELSPREIEVLRLIVAGMSNKEIGVELSVSENTIKIHLRNILDKLHLENRIQAAVYAVRQGIVDDPTVR